MCVCPSVHVTVPGARNDQEARASGSLHLFMLLEVLDRVRELCAEGRG